MSTIDKIDALLEFIRDTKPYSTKVLDTTIEYRNSETAFVSGSDDAIVDVTRTNNDFDINSQPIALRFYQPYDRVEAFEYSEAFNNNGEITRSTVKQNKQTNRTQDYVVAKADIELTPLIVSSSPQYNPYVIFRIDALNVDPSEFALGIIEIDNYQTRLPCMDPVNNRFPVGHFEFDVGFKADGTVLANNVADTLYIGAAPVTPATVLYGTGSYIKIELDYSTQKINFYDITTSTPVFLGEYTIPDVNKTYAFACSMLNGETDTEVSIVPPPPPPPFFALLPTAFQDQTVICDSVRFEVSFDTNLTEDVILYIVWEQVDPLTNLVLPNGHGARVDLYTASDQTLIDTELGTQYLFTVGDRKYLEVYYNTPLHQDRKFKFTVYLNPGMVSQYFVVTATPNDQLTVNCNLDVPYVSREGAFTYPGSKPLWVGYDYTYPTSNPLSWIQGTVVGNIQESYLKLSFNGTSYPAPPETGYLSRATEFRLVKVGATSWDDQLITTVYDNNSIVGPYGDGVYRVDTVYKFWTSDVEIVIKGVDTITIQQPTQVIHISDGIADITETVSNYGTSDILHYVLIQNENNGVDTILYTPNQMVAQAVNSANVYNDSDETDSIAQPSFTNRSFKIIRRFTSGNIGG